MKPSKDTYVMYQLLEFIDENSIICLCKASKKLNEICKNYIEIEDNSRFEIITTEDKYNDSKLLQEYCLYNNMIKVRKMMKMDLYWNWGLIAACHNGHMDIINLMIDLGACHWDSGLYYACGGGHLDIVKLMIEKGASTCNSALYYACEGDHIDIVKLLIEKDADGWNGGLEYACKSGHMDIVNLMIEKGATHCWNCYKSMEKHLKKK